MMSKRLLVTRFGRLMLFQCPSTAPPSSATSELGKFSSLFSLDGGKNGNNRDSKEFKRVENQSSNTNHAILLFQARVVRSSYSYIPSRYTSHNQSYVVEERIDTVVNQYDRSIEGIGTILRKYFQNSYIFEIRTNFTTKDSRARLTVKSKDLFDKSWYKLDESIVL